MKRRDAREAAFIILFERSFHSDPMQELLDRAVAQKAVEIDKFSSRLALQADENLEEIDRLIESFLTGWKLARLPRVTLSILRLTFCELLFFPDIPVQVSINEAVELAKKYATEEDAAYINGVLGAFVRKQPPVKDGEAARFNKSQTAQDDA